MPSRPSLATIWRKTGLMPRWLVAISYLVAVGLLIFGDLSMWVAMAFPTWVLVVSGLILARRGLFDNCGPAITEHRRTRATAHTGHWLCRAPRKHSSLLSRLYFHEIA